MAILGSQKSYKFPWKGRKCLQPLKIQHVGDVGHLSGQSHQTTIAEKAHLHPVLAEMANHFNEENDSLLSNSQKVQTSEEGFSAFLQMVQEWNFLSYSREPTSKCQLCYQRSICKKTRQE